MSAAFGCRERTESIAHHHHVAIWSRMFLGSNFVATLRNTATRSRCSTRRAIHEVSALLTSVKYSSYEAGTSLKTDCVLTHTVGPGKDQRVGYHLFAPVALGASEKTTPSPTFSGIYTARAPFRAVGCTSMCVDKKVCSLHVPTLVTLPCFFSFSVVLINPQQSAESAIYLPHRVLRLGACAKTKPHGSSVQPSFLGSRKAATLKSAPVMSTQFSDFPDLTQQRSCDSFPLRCRVAQTQ